MGRMGRSHVVNLANFQQFTAINVLSDPGAIGGPVVIPQCAQIVLRWNLQDGKTAHNVLYGRYAGGFVGTVAQANGIMTALTSGAAWTALAATLHPATTFAGVDIRDVNTANQAIISSTNAVVPGTGTGTAQPNEVALCATLRTALAGKSNRGRIFITGFDSLQTSTANVVAAGCVTALSNWAATLLTAFAAQGYTLVIGQKARAAYTGSTGTFHPARPAGSVQVTSALCRDNHWDSQRRRGLR